MSVQLAPSLKHAIANAASCPAGSYRTWEGADLVGKGEEFGGCHQSWKHGLGKGQVMGPVKGILEHCMKGNVGDTRVDVLVK